jgi:hypothetical protein
VQLRGQHDVMHRRLSNAYEISMRQRCCMEGRSVAPVEASTEGSERSRVDAEEREEAQRKKQQCARSVQQGAQ